MKANELRRLKKIAARIDSVPRCYTISDVELRSAPAGSSSPGGARFYALQYDSLSLDLGGFREQIAPGAVDATIAEDDIRALFNHDSNLVLGRSAPEKGVATATLAGDSRGLLVDIPELPDTSYAHDLYELLNRGDVDQCSFGFRVISDTWDYADESDPASEVIRTLNEIRLFDVSIVTFPAYPDTVAEARSLALALAEVREGKVLAGKHYDAISSAVESLQGVLDAASAQGDGIDGDVPKWGMSSVREAMTGEFRAADETGEEADLAIDMMLLLGRAFLATDPEGDDAPAMNEILDALAKLDEKEDAEDDESTSSDESSARSVDACRARLLLLALSAPAQNTTSTKE